MIRPEQRRAMGDAKIEMLERAGYIWQDTLPGAFFHPQTGDSIDYFTVLSASFSDLAQRIQPPRP